MIDIDKLNENQKKAVEHLSGPCMVLAGPGSGKTRVIAYRIANMVLNKGVRPSRILAISFTKASSVEMKNRTQALCENGQAATVSFGTFHAIFFRILRHYEKFTLDSILDEKTKRLGFRNILKSLNVENGEDDDIITQVINEISYVKNELMDKEDFKSEVLTKEEFVKTYELYEVYKESLKKIDFDDMLIRAYELLKYNEVALEGVRKAYEYILIDEFQDVNKVQFEAIKLIAEPKNNIFVVGDEDQSIYGFRGARPDFLLKFRDYFEETTEVRLDINYRSKSDIIDTANRLINKNENRYNKVIKCNQEEKGIVRYLNPLDAEDEAKKIAEEIMERVSKKYVEYDNFAVIYRTNIQARALVDAFLNYNIPFIMKDSVNTIYDHWVSKDIIAYLNLSLNMYSNENWVRVINKPFRYISRENINKVKTDDDFLNSLITKCKLHPKQIKTLDELEIDIRCLKRLSAKNAISYIRTVLDYDSYILDYCSNRKIKPNGLIEILAELESSASNFETIEAYLTHISDVKEELQDKKKNNVEVGVTLTTMHSAKGLEFENVYVVGVNEGTIPHEKSYDVDDDNKLLEQIEEERRLMYVAITRAKEDLCMSCPKKKYGSKAEISRFIEEIEEPLDSTLNEIKVGTKIYHKRYKEGEIISKDANLITVKFKNSTRVFDYKISLTKNIIKII